MTNEELTKKELNDRFDLACKNGELDEVKHLLNSCNLKNHRDIRKNLNNGFIEASNNGQLEIVRYLLTNEELKEYVKHECVKARELETLDSLGGAYCKKTGKIGDKIDLLKQKAHLTVTSVHKTNEEKELAVTNLFNTLEDSNKKNTHHLFYFSYCPEQLVYLSNDKIKKVCESTDTTQAKLIAELLHGSREQHLDYYLNKLDSEIKVPFKTYLLVMECNDNLDKLAIDPNSEFKIIDEYRINNAFLSLFRKEGLFSKFLHDEKIKDFFNKKNKPLSLHDQAFDMIINYTKKDDVDYLFNKTKFFSLNDKQKTELGNFLNNTEEYVINILNKGGRTNSTTDFVNENINNKSFLAKLNPQAKEKILLDLDYSKIKDSESFINGFLSQLPVMRYSCYHSRILHDVPKSLTDITRYILNEKTDFSRVHVYETLHFFHLLNDQNKSKFVQQLVDDKKMYKYDYESMKENNHLDKEEKKNLEELNKLVEAQLASKKAKKPKK